MNALLDSMTTRQHTPHPAFRIWHVAKIAGNQVNVHVHSRLPGGLPNIYPDVVTVGRVLGVHEGSRLTKKLENRDLLLWRQFEEVGHVALWNHEDVATAQRMVILTQIGQFVL